jgi:hypothetical protein
VQQGINVSIVNFFEDFSHIRTYGLDQLTKMLQRHKFQISESGSVENKYLESKLLSCGLELGDQDLITYGVWLQLKWAQYVIAQKV